MSRNKLAYINSRSLMMLRRMKQPFNQKVLPTRRKTLACFFSRKLPAVNGTAFSTIFEKGGQPRKLQIIENMLTKISVHLISTLEFRECWVEWFAFRKFNSFLRFQKVYADFLRIF